MACSSVKGIKFSSESPTLCLASDLNAELRVGNTTAGVSNKIQDLALVTDGPSNYSARLGTGGPRIEVSGVTGFIVLQPLPIPSRPKGFVI